MKPTRQARRQARSDKNAATNKNQENNTVEQKMNGTDKYIRTMGWQGGQAR
jgi:hypothetical protein